MKGEMIMNKEYTDRLESDHLSEMIKLVFTREDEKQVLNIIAKETPLSQEEEVLSRRAFKRALIQQKAQAESARRKQRKTTISKIAKKALEIAACLVVIAAIGGTAAFATSATFRSQIFTLLASFDEKNQTASFYFLEDSEVEFEVPEFWNGKYYPSYIPEGFTITGNSEFFNTVELTDENGIRIVFSEYSKETRIKIGTENSTVKTVSINGSTAYIFTGQTGTEDNVVIIWSNEESWFELITYNMSETETLRIAESVQRTQK